MFCSLNLCSGHRDTQTEDGAALSDGSTEQPDVVRRQDLGLDTHSSGTLPKYRDPLRVSAKLVDIVSDPLEGEVLVLQPHVAAHHGVTEGEEAESVESVVGGDQHHTFLYQSSHPVEILRALAEAASVDPKHDRFVVVESAGGEDVESQAVL